MGKRIFTTIFTVLSLAGPWALAEAPKANKHQLNSAKKIVKEKMVSVQRCYTDMLIEVNPDLKGKLIITWEVNDKGVAENIEVKKNTSNDTALSGCVTEKIPEWNFEPASAGASYLVEHNFQFGG